MGASKLELPDLGGSYEYPQSMFKSKNIENIPGQLTPVLLFKTHIKVGYKGVYIT